MRKHKAPKRFPISPTRDITVICSDILESRANIINIISHIKYEENEVSAFFTSLNKGRAHITRSKAQPPATHRSAPLSFHNGKYERVANVGGAIQKKKPTKCKAKFTKLGFLFIFCQHLFHLCNSVSYVFLLVLRQRRGHKNIVKHINLRRYYKLYLFSLPCQLITIFDAL